MGFVTDIVPESRWVWQVALDLSAGRKIVREREAIFDGPDNPARSSFIILRGVRERARDGSLAAVDKLIPLLLGLAPCPRSGFEGKTLWHRVRPISCAGMRGHVRRQGFDVSGRVAPKVGASAEAMNKVGDSDPCLGREDGMPGLFQDEVIELEHILQCLDRW